MDLEILVSASIFLVSLSLILLDKKLSMYILIVLSVLLHKELFSIYRWNLLPVRIFMFAFLIWSVYELTNWFIKAKDLKKLWTYLKKPFIALLLLLWVVRGVSLIYTRNVFSSITLFGFFTTMVALGVYLYLEFKDKPSEILSYIKFYIYILFALCVFAYFQAFLYLKYEVIIGALWNVPGKFPRLGSLFWDVNHFGGLLASLLPVLGVLILIADRWKTRIWYGFMFLTMTGVLFFTNSRTSWILAFVAFITFLGILLFRRYGMKGVSVAAIILLLVSSLIFAEYMQKDSPFRKRIKDFFHYRIDSFDSHLMLLQGSYEIFEEKPILGGGYGGFFEHFAQTNISSSYFRRDPAAFNTRVPAHTIWGELIAETGVLGLVSFVLLITLILGTLLYLALNASTKKNKLLGAAMFSSIIGWLCAGIFYSYNSEFFFIVLFLYFLYAVAVLQEDYDLNKILSFYKNLGKIPFLFIFGLGVFLIFTSLGKNHLIPWDEAIYAGVAKNMVKNGEYFVQAWHNSRPWFEKPPLYMWLVSGLMNLFGYSSWSVRLPSAIFGLSTVVMVYYFAKKLFGKGAAFISSLALLTTVHFLYYSRASMLDVTVTFFITSSLITYYLAREKFQDGKDSKFSWLWVLSGVLVGLGIMTKGIVGLLPLPIMGIYEIYLILTSQQKLSFKLLVPYLSMLLALLVVSMPWHYYMYSRFGDEFLQNYIGYHVLDRALSSIEDKGRPFWWYLVVLKVSMRIWFIALIPSFFYSLFKFFKKNNKFVFLFIWSAFIFLFFSAAKSKLVWYIMPVYPAVVVLIGAFSKDLLDFVLSKVSNWDTFLGRFLIYFFVMVFALFYFFLNKELVYTSDLTGSQAKLLKLKDEVFGAQTKVYADRIELPLILYYSDGPFEVVDFTPLKNILAKSEGSRQIVFITKESRFRSFKEDHPQLILKQQINEWVLGYLPVNVN